MTSPERSLQADAARVVAEARAALAGAERDGVVVDTLLHYGAVDIDPRHLVVWILLSGKPDDELPEWLPVSPGLDESVGCYRWLLEIRDDLVQRFTAASWPSAETISVYADSTHRVDTCGYWTYFKG